MPFRSRNIVREMATAVAVLAVYILVLLAPLHQAAGLQGDLAKLGYAPIDGWSICSALAPENADGKPPAVVKCPAASIAKDELAGVESVVFGLAIDRAADAVLYAASCAPAVCGLNWPAGQPRAPPTA